MMTRERLVALVKGMFALLALAFLYILLSGLRGASTQTDESDEFSGIVEGQTVLRRLKGKRVWVSKLGDGMRLNGEAVAHFVTLPESGCATHKEYCVLSASTARDGIELSFTLTSPPQLNKNEAWYGGFVDPTNGLVYDRLGRAYRGQTSSVALQSIPYK